MPPLPTEGAPKAVLYYSSTSVWAAAVLLALDEKGYGPDQVELKAVDLKNGENFAPAYLRINPNGTVPTLVVPLEKSLAVGTPVKYRALTDTKSILEFLDKSRSAVSGRHSLSSAPAPALAPATIALSDLSNTMIALVHSVPINFLSVAATTPEELSEKAHGPYAEFIHARQAALQKYIAEESDDVDDGVKKLWESRHADNELVERVYGDADQSISELTLEAKKDRELFFEKSLEVWNGIKSILVQLEAVLVGPYALGDQISLADLHLGAWLTRLLSVSGAPTPLSQSTPRPGDASSLSYTGFSMVAETMRKHTGDASFTLGPKIRASWELLRERESWRKVYADGLH